MEQWYLVMEARGFSLCQVGQLAYGYGICICSLWFVVDILKAIS